MPNKWFPKDDLIALAGKIVPLGYDLRELKFTWEPEDEDGFSSYHVGIVFRFNGAFYLHSSGYTHRKVVKGFLETWEGPVPAYEVFYDAKNHEWVPIEEVEHAN